MHTSVKLNVYRIWRSTYQTQMLGKQVKNTEAINIWFKTVSDNIIEGRFFGIHNHYGKCNASTTKFNSLVGIGNRKVVDMVKLKRRGHLYTPRAIACSLNHSH